MIKSFVGHRTLYIFPVHLVANDISKSVKSDCFYTTIKNVFKFQVDLQKN